MAIVVPEAQTAFSPVSQPRQQFDGPSVGRAIAGAADTVVNVQAAKKERERTLQMQGARVTAVEQIGKLRTQFEQDPNMSGLTDRFIAASDEAINSIAETLPEGYMRESFVNDIRQTREPQRAVLARRQFALERDSARASGAEAVRTYVSQAATAPDDDSRNAILSEAAAHIGSLAEAGFYSEEEADRMIAAVASDTNLALAVRTAADDPAAFLENKAAGEYGAVDPVTLERMETSANSALASAAAASERQQIIEQEAAAKALSTEVDSAVKIIEGGLPFEGLLGLQERVAGTPEEARLNATIRAASTEGNFAVLPPLQMDQVIAEIKGQPTTDPDDLARIARLEAMRSKTSESLADDPLAHVNDRNIAQIAPLDLQDFAGVSQRIAMAESVAIEYRPGDGPINVRYFANAERDVLRQQIAEGDADTQLKLATQLVSSFGDRAPSVIAEVGVDDPLFQMAGNLVWQTNDPSAARILLQGRTLQAEGNGAKVTNATRGAVRSSVSSAFTPAQQDRNALLMQAAEAHYAAAGMMINPEAEPAQKREAFMRSVQAVAGQVTRGGVAYGGLQEVEGRMVLLPSTVNAEMVEDALSFRNGQPWMDASITGNMPYYGDQSVAYLGARSQTLSVQAIGGGQYLLAVERRNGELQYLTDDSAPDGLYRMDLSRLVKSVQAERQKMRDSDG